MMKTFIIALGAIVLCRMASAQVSFDTVSFAQAWQKAAAQHKYIMTDVYTDWCYWCKVLDKNTYSAKSVGDYASNNFIALKINAEKGDGVDFAKKYGVRGYPTIIFFDENGVEVDRVVGYQPEQKFLNSMKIARMGGVHGLEDRRKLHPNDPVIIYELAQKYADKGDTVKAADLCKQAVALDPNDSLKIAENAAYYLAERTAEAGDPGPLEQYTVQYPAAENVPQAHLVLTQEYLQKGNGYQAAKHFNAVVSLEPANAQLFNNYAWGCAQAKVNLESALVYADKAVSLAKDNTTKAVYMDTKAAILYAQNKSADAVGAEKQALDLAGNGAENARLHAELEKNLARYGNLAQK